MKPEQAMDLGRRATACPRWGWTGGMLTLDGKRLLSARRGPNGCWVLDLAFYEWLVEITPGCWTWHDAEDGRHVHDAGIPVPDLRDPATLGCLLALVQEILHDPSLSAFELPSGAWVAGGLYIGDHQLQYDERGRGPSEAEALVAALEAAPAVVTPGSATLSTENARG